MSEQLTYQCMERSLLQLYSEPFVMQLTTQISEYYLMPFLFKITKYLNNFLNVDLYVSVKSDKLIPVK